MVQEGPAAARACGAVGERDAVIAVDALKCCGVDTVIAGEVCSWCVHNIAQQDQNANQRHALARPFLFIHRRLRATTPRATLPLTPSCRQVPLCALILQRPA